MIERRTECEAATDLWYVVQNVFRQYVARGMATTRPTLDRALSRLDAAGIDPDAAECDRIQQLPLIYNGIDTLLGLTTRHAAAELRDHRGVRERGVVTGRRCRQKHVPVSPAPVAALLDEDEQFDRGVSPCGGTSQAPVSLTGVWG